MSDEKAAGGESMFTVVEQIEWACEEAEEQLRERCPSIRRIHLDPTPGRDQRRRAAVSRPPGG